MARKRTSIESDRPHRGAIADARLMRAAIDPEYVLSHSRYPTEELIAAMYRVKLAVNGVAPEAVAWASSEEQEIRFRVICEEVPLEGASILDAGCGFGEFHHFLATMGVIHTYHGIDAIPEFVQLAQARHKDATFSCMDLRRLTVERGYDVVIASGLFFLHSPTFRRRLLPVLYRASRVAFAFNVLSTMGEADVPMRFRVSPEAILRESLTLGASVRLRHDYLPNDTTVLVWRDGP
jgi:SAM-dependent methyltransferase